MNFLLFSVIRLGYGTGIPLILITILFAQPIMQVFTTNREIIQAAFAPFLIMLSTYLLSVPAYTYYNAVIGAGHTQRAFWYQIITIAIYLVYLWFLTQCRTIPLAVYWTSEQLYVIILLLLSKMFLHETKKTKRDEERRRKTKETKRHLSFVVKDD